MIKKVFVKRPVLLFLLVVPPLFFLWNLKWSKSYYYYKLKQDERIGVVINKRLLPKYSHATYVYINSGDSFYVYDNVYDLIEVNDFLIKELGTCKYQIIRGADTIIVYPE